MKTFQSETSALTRPSVWSLSHVRLFATPWKAACQAALSITNSRSLPRLMSIESVMPSNHLILCCPLLLPASILPSIRVFSNESVLHIRWPKYWSLSFSIGPSLGSSQSLTVLSRARPLPAQLQVNPPQSPCLLGASPCRVPQCSRDPDLWLGSSVWLSLRSSPLPPKLHRTGWISGQMAREKEETKARSSPTPKSSGTQGPMSQFPRERRVFFWAF